MHSYFTLFELLHASSIHTRSSSPHGTDHLSQLAQEDFISEQTAQAVNMSMTYPVTPTTIPRTTALRNSVHVSGKSRMTLIPSLTLLTYRVVRTPVISSAVVLMPYRPSTDTQLLRTSQLTMTMLSKNNFHVRNAKVLTLNVTRLALSLIRLSYPVGLVW